MVSHIHVKGLKPSQDRIMSSFVEVVNATESPVNSVVPGTLAEYWRELGEIEEYVPECISGVTVADGPQYRLGAVIRVPIRP